MGCVYNYKNQTLDYYDLFDVIKSELVDEGSNLSDIVLAKTRQEKAIDILDNHSKYIKKLELLYNQKKKEAKFINGEESIEFDLPYIGVSPFLSGLRNANGDLYMPEFIDSEYWSRRFNSWAQGDFSEDEIEILGLDKNNLPKIASDPSTWKNANGSWKEDSDGYVDFGSDEQKKMMLTIRNRWKHQAAYGTEIHNVMEGIFSKKDGQTYWFDILESPNPNAFDAFELELRSKNKITDITTKEKIRLLVNFGIELKNKFRQRQGFENCIFIPEFTISAPLNKDFVTKDGKIGEAGKTELLGRIDLLILDNKGVPSIVDYKTSPHDFNHFYQTKRLNYTYLQATYERMLRKLGLNTSSSNLYIAPLQMVNFHLENGVWNYDEVKSSLPGYLETLNPTESQSILNNLNDFMEAPIQFEGEAGDLNTNVDNLMKKWFPRFGSYLEKTDEQIRKMINDQDAFKGNKETGLYEFEFPGSKFKITSPIDKGEALFFLEVKNFYHGNLERKIKTTHKYIDALKVGMLTGDSNNMDLPRDTPDWVRLTLSKYCTQNWEVVEDDAAEAVANYGLILVRNKFDGVIEGIKVSTHILDYVEDYSVTKGSSVGKLGKRTNILANFDDLEDIKEDSKSNTLILKMANGNIELMESMLLLNALNYNLDLQIGRIHVISSNSKLASGLTASNKELLYNFNALMNAAKKEDPLFNIENNFNGNIHMLSDLENCYRSFKEVIADSDNNKFTNLELPLTILQDNLITLDKNLVIALLNILLADIESKHGLYRDKNGKNSAYYGLSDWNDEKAKCLYLLGMIAKARLDLNNIDIRQLLKDHDNYISSAHFLTEGLYGNMLDNAGNFGNALLNLASLLVLEGNLNAKDIAFKQLNALKLKTRTLKQSKGFTSLLEYTIGNLTSIFDKMTKYDNGDLVFTNPWKPNSLSLVEVDYLKFAISTIYKNKHPEADDNYIEVLALSDDLELLQVPLIEGSFASKVNSDGWIGWLKNKLKVFKSWDSIKNAAKDAASLFLSDTDELYYKNDEEIFKALNLMEQGSGSKRFDTIARLRNLYGDGFFERDLERLLTTNIWGYALYNAMKERMPLLKSIYISLGVAGNFLNSEFVNDEKFLEEFTLNKVNKMSIVDPRFKETKGALGAIQKAASWMALAFSPVQMSYQLLQGIMNDCKLIITKPDGEETFTFDNMKTAALEVYKDFARSADNSVIAFINGQYGINDMDASSFALNNSTNKHGLYNFFDRTAYHFSSRPDYYNRMTIFVAQMLKDGSFDAHSIKNGLLVYNWKEDKRFEAYAKNNKSNIEAYNKAKALYFATAQLLIKEGARNSDGSLFTLSGNIDSPTDLPKAYSNLESEAKKAVGDNMYGYYDDTKKSLFASTLLGSLVMLMRTYWSSKKNQYLAPGGVKNLGKFDQAKNLNGEPLFYPLTESGEIDSTCNLADMVTKDSEKCSNVPFMLWKGKFEEGALVTLCNIVRDSVFGTHTLKEAWDSKWNANDPDMQKAYRSGIKLMMTDFIMLLLFGFIATGLLGDWAEEEKKHAKKTGNLGDAGVATFANIAHRTMKNASADFNWVKSIFDVTLDANPFALASLARTASSVADMVMGDQSFTSTVVRSFSASNLFKPLFDYLESDK